MKKYAESCFMMLNHLILTTTWLSPLFILGGETEAKRGKVACPSLYSRAAVSALASLIQSLCSSHWGPYYPYVPTSKVCSLRLIFTFCLARGEKKVLVRTGYEQMSKYFLQHQKCTCRKKITWTGTFNICLCSDHVTGALAARPKRSVRWRLKKQFMVTSSSQGC